MSHYIQGRFNVVFIDFSATQGDLECRKSPLRFGNNYTHTDEHKRTDRKLCNLLLKSHGYNKNKLVTTFSKLNPKNIFRLYWKKNFGQKFLLPTTPAEMRPTSIDELKCCLKKCISSISGTFKKIGIIFLIY